MTIASERQKLAQDPLVTLCTLDATDLGGIVYRFTHARNGTLTFDGETYSPIDFKTEGFEIRSDGEPAVPTISISKVSSFVSAFIRNFDDGKGALFTRTRTYRMFLDDGSDPDPTQTFPPEIYYIERKKMDDGETLEWELSSILDQEGMKFPIRQVVRGYCDYIYRYNWNGTIFAGTLTECPYSRTGTDAYFDRLGQSVVDPADDACGKRLSDCKLRFGEDAILPYRGFPGVGRVR